MLHALKRIRVASMLCIAMIILAASVISGAPAQAGQVRGASSPIPGRITKVKEGDWVLVRLGENELIKETATKITDIKGEGKPGDESYFEPVYMVEYTLEKFDGATGSSNEAPMNVVRALEHEIEENAEMVSSMSGKPQRRKVKIDGKNVNIVVIPQVEEGGVTIENWFTDEFGIDGRAGMVIRMDGETKETFTPMEVVAFGNARQPLTIQKYLKKN